MEIRQYELLDGFELLSLCRCLAASASERGDGRKLHEIDLQLAVAQRFIRTVVFKYHWRVSQRRGDQFVIHYEVWDMNLSKRELRARVS